MKLIISQAVYFDDQPKFPHRWTKEIDNPVVYPHNGDKIEDSIWKDPYEYEVVDVVIDYSSNEYYVTVKEYSDNAGKTYVIPSDRKGEFAHMSELNGWIPSWERFND